MAPTNNHTCIKTDVFEQIHATLEKIDKALSEKYVTRAEFELQKNLWLKEKELAEERAQKTIQKLESDLKLAVAQREKEVATLRMEQVQGYSENQKDITMIKTVGSTFIGLILVAVI